MELTSVILVKYYLVDALIFLSFFVQIKNEEHM